MSTRDSPGAWRLRLGPWWREATFEQRWALVLDTVEQVEVLPVGRGYRGDANPDNCGTPKGEAAVEALHAEHDE